MHLLVWLLTSPWLSLSELMLLQTSCSRFLTLSQNPNTSDLTYWLRHTTFTASHIPPIYRTPTCLRFTSLCQYRSFSCFMAPNRAAYMYTGSAWFCNICLKVIVQVKSPLTRQGDASDDKEHWKNKRRLMHLRGELNWSGVLGSWFQFPKIRQVSSERLVTHFIVWILTITKLSKEKMSMELVALVEVNP